MGVQDGTVTRVMAQQGCGILVQRGDQHTTVRRGAGVSLGNSSFSRVIDNFQQHISHGDMEIVVAARALKRQRAALQAGIAVPNAGAQLVARLVAQTGRDGAAVAQQLTDFGQSDALFSGFIQRRGEPLRGTGQIGGLYVL